MKAFAVNTQKLAQTARTGSQEAVVADMVSALACKSCHDVYREKK
jgi:cytochrome c556